jgi:hypothetical protein
MARLRKHLADEQGDALVSGLLALGLVLLVVALAIQLLAFAHANNVAQPAALDGAAVGAAEGTGAGVTRAGAILAAAGGTGAGLRASASAGTTVVTVRVSGQAPHVFPGIDLLLPSVSAHASAPTERYPQDETRQ